MHACHFELLPDLKMVPIFWNSLTDPLFSMLKTKMLLEYDDNLDTTISTELSIIHVIGFPFWANCGVSQLSTHMNIRVLSKIYEAIEPLAFHRAIDRDHEQKLVLTRLFALLPVAVCRLWVFWTSSKYRLYLSSILLAQHCALNINIRSSVFLAPSQENKT